MYIVLALLAGGVAGAITHLVVANRYARGVIVSGAVGTVSAAIIYTALTWAGIAQNNIWLWVASIGGAVVITWVFTLILTNMRVAADQRRSIAAGIR